MPSSLLVTHIGLIQWQLVNFSELIEWENFVFRNLPYFIISELHIILHFSNCEMGMHPIVPC